MIRIILTAVLIILSLTSFSQEQEENQQVQINVVINEIVSNDGIVNFAIYTEKGFLETPFQVTKAKIVDGKSAITFNNIETGTYSIVCYHDSNENGQLDFSESRRPLEDVGVSFSTVMFGPPTFNKTKFVVTENMEIEIKF